MDQEKEDTTAPSLLFLILLFVWLYYGDSQLKHDWLSHWITIRAQKVFPSMDSAWMESKRQYFAYERRNVQGEWSPTNTQVHC